MKCFRKTFKLILCVMFVIMSMTLPTKAAEETNIALNKPATSTTVEGAYITLNTTCYARGMGKAVRRMH